MYVCVEGYPVAGYPVPGTRYCTGTGAQSFPRTNKFMKLWHVSGYVQGAVALVL